MSVVAIAIAITIRFALDCVLLFRLDQSTEDATFERSETPIGMSADGVIATSFAFVRYQSNGIVLPRFQNCCCC